MSIVGIDPEIQNYVISRSTLSISITSSFSSSSFSSFSSPSSWWSPDACRPGTGRSSRRLLVEERCAMSRFANRAGQNSRRRESDYSSFGWSVNTVLRIFEGKTVRKEKDSRSISRKKLYRNVVLVVEKRQGQISATNLTRFNSGANFRPARSATLHTLDRNATCTVSHRMRILNRIVRRNDGRVVSRVDTNLRNPLPPWGEEIVAPILVHPPNSGSAFYLSLIPIFEERGKRTKERIGPRK